MKDNLYTERLTLRPLTPDDFGAVHSWARDPANTRYMAWGPNDGDATRAFLASVTPGKDFAVTLNEAGAVIGSCGIYPDGAGNEAEIGWILRSDYWKRGYGTELGGALIKYGFEDLKLRRLFAPCAAANYGSYRVMERNGMHREALHRKAFWARVDKEWVDKAVYAILAEDYFKERLLTMEAEYNCPLVGAVIGGTICYDIQMVTGGMINKRILQDYEGEIDSSKVTLANAEEHCPACPFNQLLQAKPQMAIAIRQIEHYEIGLMGTFLYGAIHVPPGTAPPPGDIIFAPEIYAYIKDFGKEGDACYVAERGGGIIGMAWARILPGGDGVRGYGNIDVETPELTISVLPDERGRGVGEKLLRMLHGELARRGFKRISLSVQKTNRALRLYKRAGYELVEERETDFLMVKRLPIT